MTDATILYYRAKLNAEIIDQLSSHYGITIERAMDIYYNSVTFKMIEDKVADLHCRSAKYLSSLVWEEYLETHSA